MSVGEYLAQQRRLRGISVDELCELTKIPRRNLERLEAGAFDEQPDGFARGFVRTVAEALGLDPAEAVMRLMQEPEADAYPTRGVGAWLYWVAGGVLVVAVALLGWKLGGDWLASGREAEVQEPLTFRRDAVGDLAREQSLAFPASRADADTSTQEPLLRADLTPSRELPPPPTPVAPDAAR